MSKVYFSCHECSFWTLQTSHIIECFITFMTLQGLLLHVNHLTIELYFGGYHFEHQNSDTGSELDNPEAYLANFH